MTKFVCVSDLHNKYDKVEIPEGDYLLIAGDFSFEGRHWEWKNFFRWIEKQEEKFKEVLFVAGNHDGFSVEANPNWLEEKFDYVPGIYLQDSFVELDGFKIYGMPWTPTYYDWAFQATGERLKQKSDAIPDDVDILISHGPPFQCGDMNGRGDNCGDGFLAERVKKLENLKLMIFGHIHESYGEYYFGNSKARFINVSTCDGRYAPVNPPVVVELKK